MGASGCAVLSRYPKCIPSCGQSQLYPLLLLIRMAQRLFTYGNSISSGTTSLHPPLGLSTHSLSSIMENTSSEALWNEKDKGIQVDATISNNSKDPIYPCSNKIQSPQTEWSLTIITLSLALGTFLVALDTMIIGIAVPSITSEFKSLDAIAWYGSAYLLTTTALQPSFGKLYTQYSAKTIYLCCVALFEGMLSIWKSIN